MRDLLIHAQQIEFSNKHAEKLDTILSHAVYWAIPEDIKICRLKCVQILLEDQEFSHTFC